MRQWFLGLCVSLLTVTGFAKGTDFKVETWKTSSGLEVYYVHLKQLPIVDVRLIFDAGSARDAEKKGIAALTNTLLNQGGKTQDANAIAEAFASLGTEYYSSSGKDFGSVGFRSLTEKVDESNTLLSTILKDVDFPEDAFRRERKIQLASIAHSSQNPQVIADEKAYERFFIDHPYASPSSGYEKTVQVLRNSDVAYFYQRFYSRANGQAVIVGDVEKSKAKQLAETLASALSDSPKADPLSRPHSPRNGRDEHINFPSKQMQIRIVGMGVTRDDPDYVPLQVANYVLGGGALVSRLTEAVREKNGLAYNVSSAFIPMKSRGVFWVSLGTRNEQASQALKLTREVIDKFIKTGPTQKELVAAKKYLTGSFPLKMDSNRDITSLTMMMAFYHLPKNYFTTYVERINRVKLADVQRVLKEHLKSAKLLTVTVGQKNATMPRA